MRILEGFEGLRKLPAGMVLSIGNFDGIHLGHQAIFQKAFSYSKSTGATGFGVVTFEPHPLTVLRPEMVPPRLTLANQKEEIFRQFGVTDLVILSPTSEVLNCTAEQFWAMLRHEVKPTHLVEGNAFTFGKARGGDISRLREWSKNTPVKLDVIEPLSVVLRDKQVVEVSSSLVRWLVSYGRMRDTEICLGRPYTLEGKVIKGNQRGRTIGVPTANLYCPIQMIPADGVYGGFTSVNGIKYPTAISIGTLPTFGDNQRQIEAHLIGFTGDLYDQTIRVSITNWIRDQRKFQSIDALKEQLSRDIAEAADLQTTGKI